MVKAASIAIGVFCAVWPSTAAAGLIITPTSPPVSDIRIFEVCQEPAHFDSDGDVVEGKNCNSFSGRINGDQITTEDGSVYKENCVPSPDAPDTVPHSGGLIVYPPNIPVICTYSLHSNPPAPVTTDSDVSESVDDAGAPTEPTGALVPACRGDEENCATPYAPSNYGTCEFVALINNIITFVLWFVSIAATIVILYAGFRLVTSGGDVGAKSKAKEHITNVIIGYVIALAAFLIVTTFLSILLGDTAVNRKILSWQIECVYPYQPERVDLDEKAGRDTFTDLHWYIPQVTYDIYGNPVYVDVPIGTGSPAPGGGSCSVLTSGACSVSNMGCFGSRAADASKICNFESGGGRATNVASRTDLCLSGHSFSVGIFQINLLANGDRLGCTQNYFTSTPIAGHVEGGCARYVTNSRGVRYCQFRNCRITNEAGYQACFARATSPSANIRVACDLFKNGGFAHWETTRRSCNIPR